MDRPRQIKFSGKVVDMDHPHPMGSSIVENFWSQRTQKSQRIQVFAPKISASTGEGAAGSNTLLNRSEKGDTYQTLQYSVLLFYVLGSLVAPCSTTYHFICQNSIDVVLLQRNHPVETTDLIVTHFTIFNIYDKKAPASSKNGNI